MRRPFVRADAAGDMTAVVDTDSWAGLTEEVALAAMLAPDNVAGVRDVFATISTDPVWTPVVLRQLDGGRLDLRLAIAWLARQIEPDSYLEVGVRRGFSAAVLGAVRPDATMFGFDMWMHDYAGAPNPGPAFVRSELERVGYRGNATFIDGDSHRTLPLFFGVERYPLLARLRGQAVRAPAEDFDMILVDGDHSIEGAYRDLCDVIGHVRVGGALVFDDIAPDLTEFDDAGRLAIQQELGPDPHGRGGLLGVWHAVRDEHPEFRFFEFTRDAPGVAFAIRMR